MVGQTIGIPQLLHTVIDVRVYRCEDFPVVVQRQIPLVLLFSRPLKLPSCAWTRWLMSLLAGRACLRSPIVTPPMVSLTMEIPQFFIDKVIVAPVVLVERLPVPCVC